ncbi:MAG: hypothetical protein HQK51_10725 [Oligoflexia bacterium]|nr:hypothetical protein [Oligoflexia bacterium]
MNTFNNFNTFEKQIIDFILEHKVLSISENAFTLASGKKSHIYVNWRQVSNNFLLFDKLLHMILKFIDLNSIECDTFYGVPEGATKIALFVQYFYLQSRLQATPQNTEAVLAMGRAVAKSHGDIGDRYFIGQPKGNVVIIEDVTTTGESLIKTIEVVNQLPNANVSACLVLTDRSTASNSNSNSNSNSTSNSISFHDYLKQKNILFYSLSNIKSIIKQIDIKHNHNFLMSSILKKEMNQYV